MTCKEVLELMSAGIDGELAHSALLQFTKHIDECRDCRSEYELERITRNIVHRISPVRTPASVVAAVREAIARETPAEVTRQELLTKLIRRPARTAALAFAIVGVVLIFIIVTPTKSHRSHIQPDDANIVHQTYNNFDKVLSKSFIADVKSTDATVLSKSLGKCRCKLRMPALKKCKFIKGMHSLYKNDHIAEFVFQRNDDPVYIYEAKLQDVVNGGNPRIDSSILNELLLTGWYFENHQADCSLILRLVDSTIYCAVADIDKDQLFALLQ